MWGNLHRGFESLPLRHLSCARSSVDRAPGCGPGGRGFESRRARPTSPIRFDTGLCARYCREHQWNASSSFTATRHDRSRSLGPGSRVVPGASRGRASAFLLPDQDPRPAGPHKEDRQLIIVMSAGATEQEADAVRTQIRAHGLSPHDNVGTQRVVIAVLGEVAPVREHLMSKLNSMSGIQSVTQISRPYKLASRESHPEDTIIGNGTLTIMAGPCSVENREMMLETARAVAKAGATILRGGAFKPRTSPYSFQGLGLEGLQYLAEARQATGLPVITEVMEPSLVEVVAEHADILQVGTRNMQSYSLLTAVGKAGKPVMLKRGYGATIEEWLMSAEYIVSSGNPHVILCERGIRTFETYTRNTLDLTAVPLLHHLTHLPVIVDPSHATGKRWLVRPMALAAVAAGADGIMVEVHPNPDQAMSDGEQSLTFEQFADMASALNQIHEQVRTLIKDPFAMAGPIKVGEASKH